MHYTNIIIIKDIIILKKTRGKKTIKNMINIIILLKIAQTSSFINLI